MWATVGKQASFLIPLPSIGSGPGPYCPCNPPSCLPLLGLTWYLHLPCAFSAFAVHANNKQINLHICLHFGFPFCLSHSGVFCCLSLLCLLLRLVLCFRVALLFARFEPVNWLSAVFLRMSVGGQFKSWLSWTALTMTMATQRQRQNPLTS